MLTARSSTLQNCTKKILKAFGLKLEPGNLLRIDEVLQITITIDQPCRGIISIDFGDGGNGTTTQDMMNITRYFHVYRNTGSYDITVNISNYLSHQTTTKTITVFGNVGDVGALSIRANNDEVMLPVDLYVLITATGNITCQVTEGDSVIATFAPVITQKSYNFTTHFDTAQKFTVTLTCTSGEKLWTQFEHIFIFVKTFPFSFDKNYAVIKWNTVWSIPVTSNYTTALKCHLYHEDSIAPKTSVGIPQGETRKCAFKKKTEGNGNIKELYILVTDTNSAYGTWVAVYHVQPLSSPTFTIQELEDSFAFRSFSFSLTGTYNLMAVDIWPEDGVDPCHMHTACGEQATVQLSCNYSYPYPGLFNATVVASNMRFSWKETTIIDIVAPTTTAYTGSTTAMETTTMELTTIEACFDIGNLTMSLMFPTYHDNSIAVTLNYSTNFASMNFTMCSLTDHNTTLINVTIDSPSGVTELSLPVPRLDLWRSLFYNVTANCSNQCDHKLFDASTELYDTVTALEITVNPSVAISGAPIHIIANVSSGSNVVYSISFGDMTENITLVPQDHAYDVIMEHMYISEGRFTITVQAFNSWSNTTQHALVNILSRESSFVFSTASNDELVVGQNVTFVATLVAGTMQELRVEFGDGTSYVSEVSPLLSWTVNHTYTQPGPFLVQAHVNSSGTVLTNTTNIILYHLGRPNIQEIIVSLSASLPMNYSIGSADAEFNVNTTTWASPRAFENYDIYFLFNDTGSLNTVLDQSSYHHSYILTGLFYPSVRITDTLYSKTVWHNISTNVMYICMKPLLANHPLFGNMDTPLQQHITDAFILSLDVLERCRGGTHQYTWVMNNLDTGTSSTKTSQSNRLYIEPGSMKLGIHEVCLTVAVANQSSIPAVNSTLYVEITMPQVVADMAGGNRVIGTEQIAAFSGSESYDPVGDPLKYSWTCKSGGDISSDPCTSRISSLTLTAVEVDLPGSLLGVGSHVIRLEVRVDDGRTAVVEQGLDVILGTIPPVSVRYVITQGWF